MDGALQITGINDVLAERDRCEKRRLRIVDPASFAIRQVEGSNLAVGRGDDGGVGSERRTLRTPPVGTSLCQISLPVASSYAATSPLAFLRAAGSKFTVLPQTTTVLPWTDGPLHGLILRATRHLMARSSRRCP